MSNKKIYISGLGVYSAEGYGIEETWNNILQGESGIKRKQDWNNPKIKDHYYGLPEPLLFKEELKWSEIFLPTRYSILGMYACKKAIEAPDYLINQEILIDGGIA